MDPSASDVSETSESCKVTMNSSPSKKPVKRRPAARTPVTPRLSGSSRASSPPKASLPVPACPGRSNKILILDLDETLIHTTNHNSSASSDRRYVLDLSEDRMSGTMRPYVKEFLQFAKDNFHEVVIWTAATKDYADAVVDLLFDSDSRPLLVLSREDCRYDPAVYGGSYTKPTHRLAHQQGWDPKLVLMLDDRPYTFAHNPQNGLLIRSYQGENDDNELVKAMAWMASPAFHRCDNVASLNKDGAFA